MAKYRYHALAALSGLLLALAYPGWGFVSSNLSWLAWIGLIPLLWSLKQKPSFTVGLTAGVVYFLIIFRWLLSVHPLDTLGIQNGALSFLIVLLIYFISSAGMAMFWGIFGLAFSKKLENYKLQTTNYKLLLTTPALFVLLEYLRSWGFSFLWAGSGSLFGPHWTLGNLAYALADNPLALKLASLVGIYGVTFVVIFVNCLIFWILLKRFTKFTKSTLVKSIFIGLVIVAAVFGPKLIKFQVAIRESAKQINFAIIQTAQQTKLSPSPQETLAGFKEQLELLDRVAKEYPESQLIVFPEASDFFKNLSLFLTPAQIQNYFSGLFKEPGLIISGGRIMESTGLVYSRVFSLDTQNDILDFYDKRLLTPGGEFLPYPIRVVTNLFSKLTVSQFGELRELNVGKKKVSTVGFRDEFSVAPLICSELISPDVTNETSQNADVIVSMASYGVFHGNRTIADQMLAITRFRATENKKPIITATNMGRSHIIDSRGNIVKISGAHPVRGSASNGAGILTGSVDITQQQSWYNRLGDTPMILGSLGLLIVFSLQLTVYRKIQSWVGRSKSFKNANNL